MKKINGRYLTTNGNYSISFPEKYGKDSFIKLKENDLELSWFVTFDSITLNNSKATIVTNRKSNNILSSNNIESHINYYDLSNGIDIEYTVLPYKIKENVILRKETDFSGYKMYIQKNGLVAKLNENNSIIFCDTNGKEKFIIQTPYMYDANYEISYDIELSILILREKGVIADGVLEKGVLGIYMPEFDLDCDLDDYFKSAEWNQIIRKWEGLVRTVDDLKGRPPKRY